MSTIDKALSLLNHFSETTPEIGLSQFKALSGFDKGTVHRYLKSLSSVGFLEQDPVSKSYKLGPKLVSLAHIRQATVPVSRVAAVHVDALADSIQELAHASVPQTMGMSTIHFRDGGIRGTRVGFDISEILPFHATSSGIAMLAFGSSSLLEKLESQRLQTFTENTSTDLKTLRASVEQACKNGYAYSNQTYETEVCSVAVPFFDKSKTAIGTVAIATPSSRMNRAQQNAFAVSAMATSRKITNDLGGKIPESIQDKWALFETAIQAA